MQSIHNVSHNSKTGYINVKGRRVSYMRLVDEKVADAFFKKYKHIGIKRENILEAYGPRTANCGKKVSVSHVTAYYENEDYYIIIKTGKKIYTASKYCKIKCEWTSPLLTCL